MQFDGQVALKSGPAELLEVEWTKTQRAERIARETGLFRVPRAIRFDPEAGLLEFERITDMQPLRELVNRRDPRLEELGTRIGQALAFVHERLVMPSRLTKPLPGKWTRYQGDDVFLHGDLTIDNVSVHEPTGQLVIMDWSTTRKLGGTPTFGPRLFDVVWFGGSLYHYTLAIHRNYDVLLRTYDAFTRGYLSVTHSPLSLRRFRYYRALILRMASDLVRYQVGLRSLPTGCAFAALQLLRLVLCRLYQPRSLGDGALFSRP